MRYFSFILAICFFLPLTTFAQGHLDQSAKPEEKESSLVEKIIGRDKLVLPPSFRLEMGTNAIYVNRPHYRFLHVSPYIQMDYRIMDFIYLYAIITTQYSSLSYNLALNGNYILAFGAASKANLISGGGVRATIYRHKRFRLDIFGQYQSLNESEAQPRNIRLNKGDLNLDFNDIFKDHGYLDYNWQFVSTGAKLQFNIWRFRPYVVTGYSWLMFQIKIKIDDSAANAVKVISSGDLQKIIPERYSKTRGNPIFYIGTEFKITKNLALNIAGMAYPAKESIYFGQFSIIISR